MRVVAELYAMFGMKRDTFRITEMPKWRTVFKGDAEYKSGVWRGEYFMFESAVALRIKRKRIAVIIAYRNVNSVHPYRRRQATGVLICGASSHLFGFMPSNLRDGEMSIITPANAHTRWSWWSF